jgi:oligoribonuclease NrnB/cAMP/cGMP phosphodiesterase (DHH superfamily)
MEKILQPNQVNMIIYHGGCHDGFSAAWVGHTILGDKCEYIGVTHLVKEIPNGIDGKNILMVDFSFDAEKCAEIAKRANKFIILDHHITAKETLSKFKFAHFDINKSGVTLTWEYFHPNEPVPDFLRCIETRDLWKFDERSNESCPEYCPNAKAFTYFWYNHVKFDTSEFNKYYDVWKSNTLFQKYIDIGNSILNYIEKEVNHLCKDAVDAYWTPSIDTPLRVYKVKILNSNWAVSDIGHVLSRHTGISFAVIWVYLNGVYRVSLRSDGLFNVAEVAKLYGGGGHHSAAGFTMFDHPTTLFKIRV